MKKEGSFWENERLVIIVPYGVLVVIHILMTIPMRVPVVWPDEYGYLFFAKYIAGLFVTTPLPKVEFVGTFGYSLLIAPIYWLFQDNFTTYKAILIFNSFLSSSLYIAVFWLIKYFLNADNKNAFWAGILTSLYPAYLLQSNIAYTDGFTPALYLFSLFFFYYFLKKRSLVWGVLFSITLGFFSWIHIRFIPMPLIAVVFILVLAWYRILPVIPSVVSVVILITFLVLTSIIGNYLTEAITGKLESSEEILIRLLNVVEVFFLFASLCLLSIFIYKRNLYLIISFFVSLLIGFFISIDRVAYILIPIYFILSLIVRKRYNLSYKVVIYGFLMMLVMASLFFISIPKIEYMKVVIDGIRIWGTNASGNIFYSMFSTYLLAMIGVLFLIWRLWNAGKDSGGADTEEFDLDVVTQLKFSSKIFLSKPKNIVLFFFLVTAVLGFVITVFPKEMDASHYRADHLFYGRYLEALLAGFLGIGIYKTFKPNLVEFGVIAIISLLLFFLISLNLILAYGNVITSEMEFRSSFSFFPLRGILGNINIFLYALFAVVFSILIFIFAKTKPAIGRTLLGGLFLSFAVISYYYVLVYQNEEQQGKNRIPTFIAEHFREVDTISYDKRLNRESSRNSHNYVFHLQDKYFDFFSPLEEIPASSIVVAKEDFNYRILPNAVLLDVEFGGFDYLWLNPDTLKAHSKRELMPSYYDIPLNKQWVAGVYRSGFHQKRWINGKAEVKFSLNKPDTIVNMHFIFSCSNPKGQLLILWNEYEEIFRKEIPYGVWKYEIRFKIKTMLDKMHLKFFSDLTEEDNELIGISLDELMLKSPYKEEKKKEKKYNLPNLSMDDSDISTKIWFRRNIDASLLDIKPGDTLRLPITIKNVGNSIIRSDSLNGCYVVYRWLSFAFKSVQEVSPIAFYLPDNLYPGEETEVFVDFIAPREYGKYFLEFALARKVNGNLNYVFVQKDVRPIFDLRKKTLEKREGE